MVDIGGEGKSGVVYDYEQLEEGFGLVPYFAAITKDSVGENFILTKQLMYSVTPYIQLAEGVNTFTFYSGNFARPRTIKGIAYFNFCMGLIQSGAGARTVSFQIKIYHYRASGPINTQLGSTLTSNEIVASDSSETHVFSLSGSIPATKFKAGDQIKMEVIGTRAADVNGNNEIGVDPQNRDAPTHLKPSSDNSAFSQFICNFPFKLRTGT